MSDVLQEARRQTSSNGELPFAIQLELEIRDPDLVAELDKHAEGPDREEFAIEALKIGVLALRRASTAFDSEFIKNETSRLLESLKQQFDEHSRSSHERLNLSLKEYFDPKDGRFSQRVQSLTAPDGDLARLLANSIDGDDSRLARTLLTHVGENSLLMKQLSPDQSQGLLARLQTIVEMQLGEQRDKVLREFSLDEENSALSRLIKELTSKHGDLSKDIKNKIDGVVKEFSLDEENSALSRLVKNVDRAQRTITNEFSLDNETSGLRRLKNELTTILEAHVKTNAEFQEEVKIALGKLVTKREVEAQGPQHGGTFEDAVFKFIEADSLRRGDVADLTATSVGLIKACQKGDVVITLGPDNAASGARIVIEAKEDKKYTITKAREEIDLCRKNRDAQQGIFVYSRLTAPQMDPLMRFGSDILVVWDADDPQSDAYLKAAIEISRALCFRSSKNTKQSVDFEPIDRAVNEIEKKVQNLNEVRTYAKTIHSSSDKILKRVDIDQASLETQILILRETVTTAKQVLGSVDDQPASI